jgi:hypothetical protein
MIITLVFEKNANFFAKNCQKSQKIVIITSVPGLDNYAEENDILMKTAYRFLRTKILTLLLGKIDNLYAGNLSKLQKVMIVTLMAEAGFDEFVNSSSETEKERQFFPE